jgi:hypothetical protein
MKNYILGIAFMVGVLALVFHGMTVDGAIDSSKCEVESTQVVSVGDDISSTLLSAKGNRAWAVIQQPLNATNTVALSFNEGAAAVLGQGYQLFDFSTSTGEASKITFGRNTEFPYVGAVTGKTNYGSTTLLVTECLY